MERKRPSTWKDYCYASDESGKGDFFGGPVVAAVYLNKEKLKELSQQEFFNQIRDSKKCSDFWINKNAAKIMKILNENYEYTILEPKEYNELYPKYNNMNIILSLLHNKVHLRLRNKFQEEAYRVIDAFTNKFKHYWNLQIIGIKALRVDDMCERAEEKYLACALASIIARYYYLKQIDEMSLRYNLNIPLGNAYLGKNSVIPIYRKLKEKASEEEFCKKHFRTTEILEGIIPLEKISRNCPLCDTELDYSFSKRSNKNLIRCPKYPECKYFELIHKKEQLLSEKCWKCSAPLILKFSKEKNRNFLGCSAYPNCKKGRNLKLPMIIYNKKI